MTPQEIDVFLKDRAAKLLGASGERSSTPVVYWADGSYHVVGPDEARDHFFELASAFRRLGVTGLSREVLDVQVRPGKETRIDVLFRHEGDNATPGISHVCYYLRPAGSGWQLELVEIEHCDAWNFARKPSEQAAVGHHPN